jgi:hypothetical protein
METMSKIICYTYVFWLYVICWIKPTFIYGSGFSEEYSKSRWLEEPWPWKNIDFLDINVFISLLGDKTLHDNSKFKEHYY